MNREGDIVGKKGTLSEHIAIEPLEINHCDAPQRRGSYTAVDAVVKRQYMYRRGAALFVLGVGIQDAGNGRPQL